MTVKASSPLGSCGAPLAAKGRHPCGGLGECIGSQGPASLWESWGMHWNVLYFPDWTIVMLCSLVYRNTFLIDFKESQMQLQDSQSKLPNQTILLPFCTHSIGCQSQLEFSTKYPPSVRVLCQIPVLNICQGSCGFIYHRDNSVRPVTTAFFVFPPSKQKPLVKGLFHMLVL